MDTKHIGIPDIINNIVYEYLAPILSQIHPINTLNIIVDATALPPIIILNNIAILIQFRCV